MRRGLRPNEKDARATIRHVVYNFNGLHHVTSASPPVQREKISIPKAIVA